MSTQFGLSSLANIAVVFLKAMTNSTSQPSTTATERCVETFEFCTFLLAGIQMKFFRQIHLSPLMKFRDRCPVEMQEIGSHCPFGAWNAADHCSAKIWHNARSFPTGVRDIAASLGGVYSRLWDDYFEDQPQSGSCGIIMDTTRLALRHERCCEIQFGSGRCPKFDPRN